MTFPQPEGRKAPPTGWIVAGIVAVFVILGVVLWVNWSADDDSAADNSRDAIVQPAEIPEPQAATRAQPDNTGARDATGDAVASGREAGSTTQN